MFEQPGTVPRAFYDEVTLAGVLLPLMGTQLRARAPVQPAEATGEGTTAKTS